MFYLLLEHGSRANALQSQCIFCCKLTLAAQVAQSSENVQDPLVIAGREMNARNTGMCVSYLGQLELRVIYKSNGVGGYVPRFENPSDRFRFRRPMHLDLKDFFR